MINKPEFILRTTTEDWIVRDDVFFGGELVMRFRFDSDMGHFSADLVKGQKQREFFFAEYPVFPISYIKEEFHSFCRQECVNRYKFMYNIAEEKRRNGEIV